MLVLRKIGRNHPSSRNLVDKVLSRRKLISVYQWRDGILSCFIQIPFQRTNRNCMFYVSINNYIFCETGLEKKSNKRWSMSFKIFFFKTITYQFCTWNEQSPLNIKISFHRITKRHNYSTKITTIFSTSNISNMHKHKTI